VEEEETVEDGTACASSVRNGSMLGKMSRSGPSRFTARRLSAAVRNCAWSGPVVARCGQTQDDTTQHTTRHTRTAQQLDDGGHEGEDQRREGHDELHQPAGL